MFGGLILSVTTLYCGARIRTGKKRGKEGTGLYLELSVPRFLEDVSPALASEVARQSALLPSFELARRELARRGIHLDGKKIHDTARLKGNGIQWNKENAEAMMVLRGIILVDRLDETLEQVRATMATDRQIDWQWSSPDMRAERIPDEPDHGSATLSVGFNRFSHKRA